MLVVRNPLCKLSFDRLRKTLKNKTMPFNWHLWSVLCVYVTKRTQQQPRHQKSALETEILFCLWCVAKARRKKGSFLREIEFKKEWRSSMTSSIINSSSMFRFWWSWWPFWSSLLDSNRPNSQPLINWLATSVSKLELPKRKRLRTRYAICVVLLIIQEIIRK